MKSDRRGFLKSGATLAGGLTLGAVAPAIGQTQGIGQTPASGPAAGGRPPSVEYELYPVAFIPPFHYANPVSGRK